MRRGYFNLEQYPDMQVSGGTIDKTTYKTIYLQFKGHLFADNDSGPQELKLLFWGIKQTIARHLEESICYKEYIPTLEFSDTFKDKTYTYYIMDFTFYPNDKYHPNAYIDFLDELVKKIHRDNILPSPFEFYKERKNYKLENKNINRIRINH